MYEPDLWGEPDGRTPRRLPARPLVKVAMGYIAGLIVGWALSVSVVFVFACLLLVIALILLLALRRSPHVQRLLWTCSVVAALLVGLLRIELLDAHYRQIQQQVSHLSRIGPVAIRGIVESHPATKHGWTRFDVSEVTASKWGRTHDVPGSVELRIRGMKDTDIPIGSRVHAEGDLSVLEDASLPGGFSPREFYYARSQVARVYVERSALELFPAEPPRNLWERFKRTVWSFSNHSFRVIKEQFPSEEAGILCALTLGDKRHLSDRAKSAFACSGLAHIIVISGLHFTLLLAAFLWLLRSIRIPRRRAFMIAFLAIGWFLLLVGPRVPTLRAATIAVFLMLGVFWDRRVDRLNALAAAALLILLPWPGELFLASFQFSFLAVLSLVLVMPAIQRFVPLPNRLPLSYFVQLALASLVITIAIAPVAIYHGYAWSLAAVIANLVAIPLVTIFLPLSYVFLTFHHFGLEQIANVLQPLVEISSGWLLDVAEYFAGWWWAHVPVSRIHIGLVAVVPLILLAMSVTEAKQKHRVSRPWRMSLVCLALVAVGAWWDAARVMRRPFEASFLALGQGDCTFLRTPDGGTVLVDGGPTPYGYEALTEFLMDHGVQRVHLLVLTHPQADHIGALPYVLSMFPVDLILDPGIDADTQCWRLFRQSAIQNGAEWEVVRAGDRIEGFGDLRIDVLHPRGSRERVPATDDINEQSVVLRARWQDVSFYLTGDIGFPSEPEIVLPEDHCRTVVLKVPHHGSRYASSWEFIEHLSPAVAVAEVGRNPYGHPHERVVRRYQNSGAGFFCTHWHGSVRVVCRKDDIRLRTMWPSSVYDHPAHLDAIRSSVSDSGRL